MTADLFDASTGKRLALAATIPNSGWPPLAADPSVPLQQRREATAALEQLHGQRDDCLPAADNANAGHADAGAVTLDLDDCILSGSAMTEQFLRDGLARGRGTSSLAARRLG